MRGAAILCFCAAGFVAPIDVDAAGSDHDIVVHVQKDHTAYEIRLEFTIAAPLEQTWNVLSDYDHMADILSNMDSSRIVSREGNRLTVAQIVALRFASNEEFVELVDRAVSERMSNKQIKQAIRNWKADHHRA